MLVDTFANRLQKAMNMKNIKQVELVEQTGIDKSLISNYLSGKYKAKQDKLTVLSKVLGVSETWLMGYNVPIINDDLSFDNGTIISSFSNTISIPILGTIHAGIPLEAQQDILDYIDIPKSWAKGDKTYFALKINGDSMMPKYDSKDIVIFEETCDTEKCNNHDCVIMVNSNDATFKNITITESGIMLTPLNINNSDGFKPTFYTNIDVKKIPVRILGVAREKIVKL